MVLKKLLLIPVAVLILSYGKVSAQNPIPNPGFETWYTDSMGTFDSAFAFTAPDGWFPFLSAFYWGFNSGPGHLSCYKSTDKYAGSYAAQLTVDSDSAGADIFTQFPIGYKPQQLNGYYKFTGVPGDTFAIIVGIVKGDPISWAFGDTSVIEIGKATHYFTGASVGTYTPFSIPITYNPVPDLPDSAAIFITALNFGTMIPGCQIWVDNLSFSGIIGIDEELLKSQIMMYPNPVTDDLNVNFKNGCHLGTEITIHDISGRELYTMKPGTDANSIDMSAYESGIYILRITSNENSFTKKIVRK